MSDDQIFRTALLIIMSVALPIGIYHRVRSQATREPLYRMHHELLESTSKLIASCECENGCPGCVGPLGNTGPLAKTVALGILSRLLAEAVAA